MATALGHRVFATAGTDDKCRACESLGAERGINYRSEDFVEVVKSLTGGKGANVILDMVAGPYVNRELQCLADDGRLVIIALLGGASGEINFGEVLRRRLVITGSTLRPRPVTFKRHIAQQLRTQVWPLLESGKIKPVIYQTFSLEQAADAHALMETSTHIGKIMLQVAQ
jgi:NADPH2:quinone reductase